MTLYDVLDELCAGGDVSMDDIFISKKEDRRALMFARAKCGVCGMQPTNIYTRYYVDKEISEDERLPRGLLFKAVCSRCEFYWFVSYPSPNEWEALKEYENGEYHNIGPRPH